MTEQARKILAKLEGCEVKGVAFEVSPKLRETMKAFAVQYFATLLTLKGMGLTEREAHVVADDIASDVWAKVEYCYKEGIYEMADKG